LVFFVPLSLLMAGTPDFSAIEPKAFFAVAYLGIAITLGAYGLWNLAVSRLPASKASAATNLIPVFSVLICFAFLGERFSPQQFAAAAVVLLGVLLTRSWRKS
jgi:drug/metabolite transporter (DMT)-like permease